MKGIKVSVDIKNDSLKVSPAFGKLEPKTTSLIVTENGEYLPPTNIDGFSKVSVDVEPVLEELTITENGTYTPQEGVDGFSKVIAEFETSSLPKVKIGECKSNFLNDNCINEDGIWENADLIDFSECTSMDSMFMNGGQNKLKMLDVTNWDTRKVTSFRYWFRYGGIIERIIGKLDVSAATDMTEMFWDTRNLQEIDVSDWRFNSLLKKAPAFYGCSNLTKLDVSKWNTENIQDFSRAFEGIGGAYYRDVNVNLELDVSNFDMKNATSIYCMFGDRSGCLVLDFRKWEIPNVTNANGFLGFSSIASSKLRSIIGDETIDNVLLNNTTALKGLKVNFYLISNTNLDRASLRAVINGLADLTGQTAQTLTLGATLMAKLTEEDIAIATNNNWTLS
jgi:surface protein